MPGITPDGSLPPSGCRQDLDCKSTDLMCSLSAKVNMCSCFNGEDMCVDLPRCVPTPCKVCEKCLTEYQPFVASVQGISAADQVAARFTSTCMLNRPSTTCNQVAAAITSNLNQGKRAGQICSSLGECPSLSLSALDTCNVTVVTASGTTLQGRWSQCTVEGVVNGSSVFGIAPVAGECFQTS